MKRIISPLCILMVIMILIIGIPSVSYSWFEPDTKEGVGLQFSEEAQLRAQNCSFKTYSGTMNNTSGTQGYGLVQYNDTEISSGNVTVSASTSGETTTPGIAYYKTVIKNNNDNKDTVVSLYLKNFTVSSGGSASLAVAVPTNSYRTFKSSQTDIHIVRNAHISYLVQNEARTGELVVEWFVRCDAGSVTFDPSQVYLMYS